MIPLPRFWKLVLGVSNCFSYGRLVTYFSPAWRFVLSLTAAGAFFFLSVQAQLVTVQTLFELPPTVFSDNGGAVSESNIVASELSLGDYDIDFSLFANQEVTFIWQAVRGRLRNSRAM